YARSSVPYLPPNGVLGGGHCLEKRSDRPRSDPRLQLIECQLGRLDVVLIPLVGLLLEARLAGRGALAGGHVGARRFFLSFLHHLLRCGLACPGQRACPATGRLAWSSLSTGSS